MENEKKVLIVVDMQNDFVSGALGTKEARSIEPNVVEKILNFDGEIYFTLDTHQENYLETQEGQRLPVPHCIAGTEGWTPTAAVWMALMNRNVAGVHVPDHMIEALAADKERAKAGITGVEIAAQIIRECRPYCQGVHIMALGWEAKVPEVLKLAGI